MKKLNSELSETSSSKEKYSDPSAKSHHSLVSQTNSEEYIDYPIQALQELRTMDFSQEVFRDPKRLSVYLDAVKINILGLEKAVREFS